MQAFDAADGDDDGKGADKREAKIDEFLFSVLAIGTVSTARTIFFHTVSLTRYYVRDVSCPCE